MSVFVAPAACDLPHCHAEARCPHHEREADRRTDGPHVGARKGAVRAPSAAPGVGGVAAYSSCSDALTRRDDSSRTGQPVRAGPDGSGFSDGAKRSGAPPGTGTRRVTVSGACALRSVRALYTVRYDEHVRVDVGVHADAAARVLLGRHLTTAVVARRRRANNFSNPLRGVAA